MAYVKIWIYCVWETKKRIPFLSSNKLEIFNHIKNNARKKNIYIDRINGDKKHIHCIISLKSDQTISKVIQLIKGESSFWINKQKLIKTRFEWADEYYAVSISESHLSRIREYIKNQEEHHNKKTWVEECDEFIKKYGFERVKG